MANITTHRDLRVFQTSMEAARFVFGLTRRFPRDERYGLTAQCLASSRSVPANIAEAWRKRRYSAHLVSKLTDAEGEAAETQVWLEIARDDSYITNVEFDVGFDLYEKALAQLVLMGQHAVKWRNYK